MSSWKTIDFQDRENNIVFLRRENIETGEVKFIYVDEENNIASRMGSKEQVAQWREENKERRNKVRKNIHKVELADREFTTPTSWRLQMVDLETGEQHYQTIEGSKEDLTSYMSNIYKQMDANNGWFWLYEDAEVSK